MKKTETSATRSTEAESKGNLNQMPQYMQHLMKDKRLQKLIEEQGEKKLNKKKNIPLRLCASIMSQQLSVKVAAVIFKRFLQLYGDVEPDPQQIFDTPNETLRNIGLSNAKVSYVKNVARFAIERGMDNKQLSKMSNEEIIDYLVPIKGVGRWTVEMLLMFALGREDVFAPDDLGVQNSMISLYKLDRENKKEFYEKMKRISAKWSPYRTYACLYLWNWQERK